MRAKHAALTLDGFGSLPRPHAFRPCLTAQLTLAVPPVLVLLLHAQHALMVTILQERPHAQRVLSLTARCILLRYYAERVTQAMLNLAALQVPLAQQFLLIILIAPCQQISRPALLAILGIT